MRLCYNFLLRFFHGFFSRIPAEIVPIIPLGILFSIIPVEVRLDILPEFFDEILFETSSRISLNILASQLTFLLYKSLNELAYKSVCALSFYAATLVSWVGLHKHFQIVFLGLSSYWS